MQLVLLATLPGVLALTLFFGWGTLINLAIAIPLALVFETAPSVFIWVIIVPW
jgi:electron transport complex protein RnfD